MHFNQKFPFCLETSYEGTKGTALDFTPSVFSKGIPNGQWVGRSGIYKDEIILVMSLVS